MTGGYFLTNFPVYYADGHTTFLKTFVFILIDEKYGVMLFDTGSPYNSEETLKKIKIKFNINPEDIKWVFYTHIHPDHIGLGKYFKNAKFVLSKKDYEATKELVEIVFNGGDILKFFHDSYPGYRLSFTKQDAINTDRYVKQFWTDEAFGKKENRLYVEDNHKLPEFIEIIQSPGHTYNHLCYKITVPNLNYGKINFYITGDAISNRWILQSNESERFLEPHVDFDLYFKTLNKLKKNDGFFVPAHDRPFYSKNFTSIRERIFDIYQLKYPE